MDSEIHRWRSIAAAEVYTHPQQKAVLVPRRQGKAAKSQFQTTRPKQYPKKDIEPIADILDRFADQQKKDIGTLSGGHLNPNNANLQLEKYKEQHRSPLHFGKAGSGNGESSSSVKPSPQRPTSSQQTISKSNAVAAAGKHDAALEPKIAAAAQHALTGGTTATGIGLGSMIDLLTKFDSVKLREKTLDSPDAAASSLAQSAKPTDDNNDAAARSVRRFLPSYQLNLTKGEQFKTLQTIDRSVVQRNQSYLKNADAGKLDRLQLYYDFLKQELESNGCPPEGPDVGRLQIYSECFEKLIAEFRTYAPLLAEIKNEYDRTVLSFQSDQNELNFLRTKVQKLLSQNENRLLLKFERKRAKELEGQVDALRVENEKLKAELRRKLAIYASYLPASILHEKKKDDQLLVEVENQIRTYAAGEDPITMAERHVELLKEEIDAKVEEIEDLKRLQEREYVPRITKEKVEEALHDVEDRLKRFTEKNNSLESQLIEKHSEIRQLESTLREKEQQYQFLITEYNELSEAVASSFDKRIPTENDDASIQATSAPEPAPTTAGWISDDPGSRSGSAMLLASQTTSQNPDDDSLQESGVAGDEETTSN
ncbi:hypothetical protein BC831DRAFT_483002 [Entophlyctis helioformis]|nr:hypothetical protein BC831DRAFT_483002 [Entophlyctis helioformis]